jgi:hypothetical protein
MMRAISACSASAPHSGLVSGEERARAIAASTSATFPDAVPSPSLRTKGGQHNLVGSLSRDLPCFQV